MRTLYIEFMEVRALALSALRSESRWHFVKRYALRQRIVALDVVLDRMEALMPLMYGQRDTTTKHWSN